MNGVDLNDVATFVRVADGGGFTAAAHTLGVPKSTVSRSLARLERVLGVRLVHRTTRSLALTDAGRAYYDRVRDAVTGVAEASAEVVDLGKDPRGLIRVTAPTDIGQILLVDVVGRFLERYPQVRFDVVLTSRIVDLVGEGFDLAIRASAMSDSSLVVRKLGHASMGLFGSEAYVKRRGPPARIEDLAAHALFFIRGGPGRGALVLDGPDAQRHAIGTGNVVADDMLFLHGLVAAGVGLGLLPTFIARQCTTPPRPALVRVLPDWGLEGAGLSVVVPSARHEPRRVRLFREFLLGEAKKLGFGKA